MRLLSVLLGVGLVLGLTLYVMDKVGDEGHRASRDVAVDVLPGGIVVPKNEPPQVQAGGAIDAARTVACATAAQTLRAAEDQYQALNGSYADAATLVAAGVLRGVTDSQYTIESTDGWATFRLVGQAGCP